VAYVSGVVDVPAGHPTDLLKLIQDQLEPDCPGTCIQLTLTAHAALIPLFIGAASRRHGPLSALTGTELKPDQPKVYHTAYPGLDTPLGNLQVYSAIAAKLSVEVVT
jgi:hypothetical protein